MIGIKPKLAYYHNKLIKIMMENNLSLNQKADFNRLIEINYDTSINDTVQITGLVSVFKLKTKIYKNKILTKN